MMAGERRRRVGQLAAGLWGRLSDGWWVLSNRVRPVGSAVGGFVSRHRVWLLSGFAVVLAVAAGLGAAGLLTGATVPARFPSVVSAADRVERPGPVQTFPEADAPSSPSSSENVVPSAVPVPVEAARLAELLESDPLAASSLLSTWERNYAGLMDRSFVGTLFKRFDGGTCVTLTVRVPESWVTDGSGRVTVASISAVPC